MKPFLKVVACVCLLAACGGLPKVYNVPTRHMTVTGTTMRQVILSAGSKKGWTMYEISDGLIEATLSRRGHDVTVRIPYTEDSYAIEYKYSANMYYNAKKNTIHRKYNQWVRNLDLAITQAANPSVGVNAQ